MNEQIALRATLERLLERPGMYGTPGLLEGLAVHVIHVLLTTHQASWSFHDTQVFWQRITQDLGFGDRCARDLDSQRIMRWHMWGRDEEAARLQVVNGFKRIRSALAARGRTLPRTQEWIDALLRAPKHGGPPDVLENVLYGLTLIACDQPDVLRTLFEAECVNVSGKGAQRLTDVGTSRELRARAPRRYPSETGEADVLAGIREALRRIDTMLDEAGR